MRSVGELVNAWDHFARCWDLKQGDYGDELRAKVLFPWILSKVGPVTGKRVLDIGCGNGCLLRVLASEGAKCVGIDASGRMIQKANTRNIEGSARFVHCGSGDISSDLGSFEVVTFVFTLQDVPDPLEAIRRAASCLVRGGVMLVIHEGYHALWDLKLHTTTKRRWANTRRKHEEERSQLIDWGDGNITTTFVRPDQFYRSALEGAGFSISSEGIVTPHSLDCSDRLIAGCLNDRFVGIVGVLR
jgi:ubiquinone/menaquinone biosynthesis C-methylase UbiE